MTPHRKAGLGDIAISTQGMGFNYTVSVDGVLWATGWIRADDEGAAIAFALQFVNSMISYYNATHQ